MPKRSDVQAKLAELFGPGLTIGRQEFMEWLSTGGGVTWDPEEEPMAPTLRLAHTPRADRPGEFVYTFYATDRDASRAEMVAALDLYNRRGAIEEVARELRLLHPSWSTEEARRAYLLALADRLEGK